MSFLRRVGFALAALGVVLSVGVHIASVFSAQLAPIAWNLHVGATGLGVLLVITSVKRAPWWPPRGRMRALLRDAPGWSEHVLQLTFLNFLVHFGALLFATRGTARIQPEDLLGYEARMFSAGQITVYLLCVLAWWPVPRVAGSKS
jgi:hypothetical protein